MEAVRLGLSCRALRIRRALRQSDVSARARVPRSVIGHIENGQLDSVTLGDLDRIMATLGATLDVRVRWRGEQLDRLLDEAHAATVAAVVERLQGLGWVTSIEVSFAIWGERGSIDVLAWHAPSRTVLVVEVKSVIPDLQSLLYDLDRKTRLAMKIAADLGWLAQNVARVVVVAESPTSRGRVRRHASVLTAALPDRGAKLLAWFRSPVGAISGLMFLSNASHSRTNAPTWRRERVRSRSNRSEPQIHHQKPSGAEFDNSPTDAGPARPDAPR